MVTRGGGETWTAAGLMSLIDAKVVLRYLRDDIREQSAKLQRV
ncbi:MAG: hypothetical protein ACOC0B_02340 [bacterium]